MCHALITDIKRFAVHDGPGIRTTLFLKGCPLKCIWCHNPESIGGRPQLAWYAHRCTACGECVTICPEHAREMKNGIPVRNPGKCRFCGLCEKECPGRALKIYGTEISLDDAVNLVMEDAPFYRECGGGVTVSGGEPLLQKAFTIAFLRRLKEKGVHTALDTCAAVPWESLEEALPVADLFLVDFKHSDPERHRELTGLSNERILKNLKSLSERGANIEIRIPFVPGCNDDDENMERTGRFLGKLDVRYVRLLPYHDLARSKYAALGMKDTMPAAESPGEDRIRHAADILKKFGVNAHSGRE